MLRRGDQGGKVKVLQQQLKNNGWSIKIDGDFGLRTEAALRCFQETKTLYRDGIVGSRTQRELNTFPEVCHMKDPLAWFYSVPYFSQRDNEYRPSGTCNVTSLAMVLAYWGQLPADSNKQLEDELFVMLQTPPALKHFAEEFPWAAKQGYNPRNVHGMLVWLAKQYGFRNEFKAQAYHQDVETFGLSTGPIITSGQFTASGHIIVIVGMTATGDYIVNDPWGNWERGYRGNRDGQNLIYNHDNMDTVLRRSGPMGVKLIHRIKPGLA